MRTKVYTDGACSGNPGVGGWGAIIIYSGKHEQEISGSEAYTTNNRMELKAVIEGIRVAKAFSDEKIELYSDSAYVVNAVKNEWVKKWERNGWKTVQHEDVKNKDLWIELLSLLKKSSVNFIKVKGHSDNEYNNRCDAIARGEIERKKFA